MVMRGLVLWYVVGVYECEGRGGDVGGVLNCEVR